MKVSVVVVGAGLSLRMGGTVKKPFLEIHGKPIFLHTIERFSLIDPVSEIILVVGKAELNGFLNRWQDALHKCKVTKVIPGGKRRQDSVYNGLIYTRTDADVVLVHDAVRPLVQREHIERVINKVIESGAAILAAPMKATVKEVGENLYIRQTIPRDRLWMAQTPQGFKRSLLLKVFQKFKDTDREFTDDAEMVELAGYPVCIVPGTDENIKITTPEDIKLAEALI